MRLSFAKIRLLTLSYFFLGYAFAGTSVSLNFNKLLNEAGLQLAPATNLKNIKPRSNPVQQYEYALRTRDTTLEIRYAIRPLARVKIDYEDPHSSAPDPNHLFPLLFDSMLENISTSGSTPKREYSEKQSRSLFNADWASAAAFDVTPEFSKKYKQGLLIAIHKNNKADAYTIFLYNDYSKVKKIINSSLSLVSFK